MLIQLVCAGLMDVWKEALTYPLMWLFPLLSLVTMFIGSLSEKHWVWIILVILDLLIMLFGFYWILSGNSSQLIQIQILRDQQEQRKNQNPPESFGNLVRVESSKVPLYFETDEQGTPSLDPARQEGIATLLNSLPEVLTDKPTAIYFVSQDSFVKQDPDFITDEFAAYTLSQNGTIVVRVRPDGPEGCRIVFQDGSLHACSEPESYQEILIHELCHLLDVQFKGPTPYLSSREDFLELYQNHGQEVGEYGATDPKEFFAEAGVYYFLYPDQLATQSPEIFRWFEDYAGAPKLKVVKDKCGLN